MSATITTIKPRYRMPNVSVSAYVECSLDEFSTSDILAYLNHLGENSAESGGGGDSDGLYLTRQDLDRIETLTLCGQRDAARSHLLQIVGTAIGRTL